MRFEWEGWLARVSQRFHGVSPWRRIVAITSPRSPSCQTMGSPESRASQVASGQLSRSTLSVELDPKAVRRPEGGRAPLRDLGRTEGGLAPLSDLGRTEGGLAPLRDLGRTEGGRAPLRDLGRTEDGLALLLDLWLGTRQPGRTEGRDWQTGTSLARSGHPKPATGSRARQECALSAPSRSSGRKAVLGRPGALPPGGAWLSAVNSGQTGRSEGRDWRTGRPGPRQGFP